MEQACAEFCERVNARVHRETGAVPLARLAAEREMLHPLPDEPHALALGEERLVGDDKTMRFGSVRYSTPPGHADTRVWCRAAAEELVITARTGAGAAEIARHRLSVPGSRRSATSTIRAIPAGTGRASPGRGPKPRPRSWPSQTARSGGSPRPQPAAHPEPVQDGPRGRVGRGGRRRRMDAALGLAALADRFADGDLASIIDHLAAEHRPALIDGSLAQTGLSVEPKAP